MDKSHKNTYFIYNNNINKKSRLFVEVAVRVCDVVHNKQYLPDAENLKLFFELQRLSCHQQRNEQAHLSLSSNGLYHKVFFASSLTVVSLQSHTASSKLVSIKMMVHGIAICD